MSVRASVCVMGNAFSDPEFNARMNQKKKSQLKHTHVCRVCTVQYKYTQEFQLETKSVYPLCSLAIVRSCGRFEDEISIRFRSIDGRGYFKIMFIADLCV